MQLLARLALVVIAAVLLPRVILANDVAPTAAPAPTSAAKPRPIVRDNRDGISLWRPAQIFDGQLIVAEMVVPTETCRTPSVTWQGRTYRPFAVGAHHVTLLPVPLGHVAPDEVLAVKCGRTTTRFPIPIAAGTFPESVLSVDPKFSSAPPPRVKEENAAIAQAFRSARKGKLWQDAFSRPTVGVTTSPFGVKRTFNGQMKSRHRGVDYDGAEGDEIIAANDGVVALVASDYYFIGNAVFIDHGDDLFTVYFHMTSIDVKQGDSVKRGQRLGGIGKTGRVTGPHLHFAVKLANTYVNPDDLLSFEPGMRFSETETAPAPQ